MSLTNPCNEFVFEMDANSFIPANSIYNLNTSITSTRNGISSVVSTPTSKKKQRFKKKPYRFSCASDILLLKTVIGVNPYTTLHSRPKWEEVADNLREHFLVDGRRCRERTSLILNYYLSEENSSFRKVGTEEDIKERDKLLQELTDLKTVSEAVAYSSAKNAKVPKDSDLDRNIENYTASIEERNNGASSSSSDGKDLNPAKRKKKKKELENFFNEKRHAAELALKREELSLKKIELAQEQQRLNMEKEKFELEKLERQTRLEMDLEIKRMEREERHAMAELIKDLIRRQSYPITKQEEIIDPN